METSPKTATAEMPLYCFDVIINRLNNTSIPKCPANIPDKKFPLFVTWKKGSERHLRGCIGTFSRDLRLYDGLPEYALTSAFRDTRFDPISIDEVPSLLCSVSLLVKFEPIKHYADWTIGVHGIRIEYKQNGHKLSAVYLPEVMVEEQWDHVETLNHLMRKGGFHGDITEADRLSVTLERFQSEKAMLTFEEYVYLKQQRGENVPLKSANRSGPFNYLA